MKVHSKTDTRRLHVHINGIVQGVGFRPYVYKLAQELNLCGFVINSSNGVEIEIQGDAAAIRSFLKRLPCEAPPLADIISIENRSVPAVDCSNFQIRKSLNTSDAQTLISPDISVCDDCLRELFDPSDRRYLYPFINCTNCGPRFTIINNIPYDRPYTSMASFRMCPECQREYDDPADRRFHAQPNACPQCGPQIWYEDTQETNHLEEGHKSIERLAEDLLQGKIAAIKGLGGFHLAVDAFNDEAVQRLRDRKNREEKPLAIMLNNMVSIKKLCKVNEKEEQLLSSPQRPIVLLEKRGQEGVSARVAPGNRRLGVMLPYTPLHYIIFRELEKRLPGKIAALVMTSANLSEEPIAISNEEARRRLSNIADRFLMHNREILVRGDDSVLILPDKDPLFLRRSRGYVPRPVFLKEEGPSVLAVGGELKNTVCLTKGNRAFLSQHIGDLENLRANDFFEEAVAHLRRILEIHPRAIACDMHPAYFSTQWAENQKELPLFRVQHHHAHLASVLAERHIDEPVIGIILDGSGYGYDKTIWGGEILIADFTQMQRYAWLQPLPLPGGETAIKQPWRTAVSYLHAAFGNDLPGLPFFKNKPVESILQMLDKGINSPLTSSCGRLFDAVAAMSGGRTEIRYEAQAAIELTQAVTALPDAIYDFEISAGQILLTPLIRSLVKDLILKKSFSYIAGKFHQTLISLFRKIALQARKDTTISKVVLSGGVLQNEILINGLTRALERQNFSVFNQRLVPPNDGGIALGQAAVALRLLKEKKEKVLYSVYH